jgi:ribosomal protein S18 acetylase RimI-like enzyme
MMPWASSLIRDHGRVKYESFRNEMDATVFSCLGKRDGCIRLMKDLAGRTDFVPEATWLALGPYGPGGKLSPIGTIQGLRVEVGKDSDSPSCFQGLQGSIQNVGIIPGCRGMGIGRVLLAYALAGFQDIGCKSVTLEVTTHNTSAIRLYTSMQFSIDQTVYKVADVPIA